MIPSGAQIQARQYFEKEFMLQDDDGKLHSVTCWLEDNDGYPSFYCRNGTAQLGITLANYRAKNEIDELITIAREMYRIMRKVCYLPYRHRDIADPAISSWVSASIESMRTGKDLVMP